MIKPPVHERTRMAMVVALAAACMLAAGNIVFAAEDIVIADFENTSASKTRASTNAWTFWGPAFEFRQAEGNFTGYQGQRVLASNAGLRDMQGDALIGRALSPSFTIERSYINFLISGGNYPGRTCLNLMVNGQAVRSATGNASWHMKQMAFDVSALLGKQAQLELIDQEVGPWGHIAVDHILQSDTPTSNIISNHAFGSKGTVHTRTARLTGVPELTDGQLRLDGQLLELSDIVLVDFNRGITPSSSSSLIRLTNGEIVVATIDFLDSNKLILHGSMLGKQELAIKEVAQIDFVPRISPSSIRQTSTLYRTEGEPIPGKFHLISGSSVTFDCPLGELKLPLHTLVGYRFDREADSATSAAADEVGLVDGSVLRGKVAIDADKLVLTHPFFKSVSVNWRDVRHFILARPDVMWMDPSTKEKTELAGPLFPPPAPTWVARDGAGSSDLIKAIRIGARTVARYSLPASQDKRMFRAVLSPVLARHGDVAVGMEVSGQSIFQQTFHWGEESKVLSLDLPAGSELVVRVDFGTTLTYPCGVDLGDAYVVLQP